MNMPFPSREQVEFIRKNYPPGTRVMLNNMRIFLIRCATMSGIWNERCFRCWTGL